MKNTILRECLRIAIERNPTHPEWGHYHHFSFIVQANRILEWGINRKGPPLTQYGYKRFGKLHSETEAFRKAKGILDHGKKFEIVNVRLNRSGDVRLSKPCKTCYSFLKSVGDCGYVWFTTDVGWARIKII